MAEAPEDMLVTDRDGFERELGQLLVRRGKLDPRALERALRVRGGGRDSLLELLPKLGVAAERAAVGGLGHVFQRRNLAAAADQRLHAGNPVGRREAKQARGGV